VPPDIIRTTAISKSFRGRPAVRNVSLEVERGSVYAFLGPNGAGKSTTIRMLLGLLRPDAGTVELFGLPLKVHRGKILEKTGSLVETPSLYPHLSARENLEIARRILGAPRSEIDRVLTLVGLENRSRDLVRTYSLGMKQRLGLASALLGRRELLLLDEPMNGLDPAGMTEMRALIRDLPARHGVTVVLSSHLLGEVEQVATHVGMLSQGELVFQGPASALDRLRKPRLRIVVNRPDDARTRLAAGGWTADRVNVNASRNDDTLHIDGDVDAAAVNRALVEGGHDVRHLAVESATLEDLFLSMTKAGVQ
jgi:ABC-2 type transport system ATP-binding protein